MIDQQSNQTKKPIKMISKHEFYFEIPLYEEIPINKLENDFYKGDVDAYSAKNQTDTTYEIDLSRIDTQWVTYKGNINSTNIGYYLIKLTCKRKNNDVLMFTIYKDWNICFKMGQFPSLADLQFSEIGKKYDKVLPTEDLKNL